MTGENDLSLLHLKSSLKWVQGPIKGQTSLGYGNQNSVEVGIYFEQQIQLNSYCGPSKYNQLYAYKRIYLVW